MDTLCTLLQVGTVHECGPSCWRLLALGVWPCIWCILKLESTVCIGTVLRATLHPLHATLHPRPVCWLLAAVAYVPHSHPTEGSRPHAVPQNYPGDFVSHYAGSILGSSAVRLKVNLWRRTRTHAQFHY